MAHLQRGVGSVALVEDGHPGYEGCAGGWGCSDNAVFQSSVGEMMEGCCLREHCHASLSSLGTLQPLHCSRPTDGQCTFNLNYLIWTFCFDTA